MTPLLLICLSIMTEFISEPDVEVSWAIDTTPDYSLVSNFTETYVNDESFNYNITIIEEQFVVSEDECAADCAICMESRENDKFCQLNCQHYFCTVCVETILHLPRAFHCPLCREKVATIKVVNTALLINP
jgi:hypothetical protein